MFKLVYGMHVFKLLGFEGYLEHFKYYIYPYPRFAIPVVQPFASWRYRSYYGLDIARQRTSFQCTFESLNLICSSVFFYLIHVYMYSKHMISCPQYAFVCNVS